MARGERQDSKLLTLEIGRFCAALAVVLFHYSAVVQDYAGVAIHHHLFRPFHVGVPYFFVLSGFIIYHVHGQDFGQPGAVRAFLAKRAIRLYPMFWAISLPMLAGFLLVPALAQERALSLPGVAADLLLLPHEDAVLSISWTLRHEMLFYAIFALALWAGRALLFWLLPLWIALSLALAAAGGDEGNLGGFSIVASALNLGFGLGLLVALARERGWSLLPPGPALAAGVLLLAGTALAEWRTGAGLPHGQAPLGMAGTIAYLAGAALLVHGLVGKESGREAGRESGWRIAGAGAWKMLGGSSYILYLVHQPLASFALRAARPLGNMPPHLLFWLLVALAVAAALAVHLLVERPLLARLRARMAAPALVRQGAGA